MPEMKSRGKVISLTDKVMKVSYASREMLVPFFPAGEDQPILWGHRSHPYFNLYGVRGPVKINREGARMQFSSPFRLQLTWSESLDGKPQSFWKPHRQGTFLNLVTTHMLPPEIYLIAGRQNCYDQLEAWGALDDNALKLL